MIKLRSPGVSMYQGHDTPGVALAEIVCIVGNRDRKEMRYSERIKTMSDGNWRINRWHRSTHAASIDVHECRPRTLQITGASESLHLSRIHKALLCSPMIITVKANKRRHCVLVLVDTSKRQTTTKKHKERPTISYSLHQAARAQLDPSSPSRTSIQERVAARHAERTGQSHLTLLNQSRDTQGSPSSLPPSERQRLLQEQTLALLKVQPCELGSSVVAEMGWWSWSRWKTACGIWACRKTRPFLFVQCLRVVWLYFHCFP